MIGPEELREPEMKRELAKVEEAVEKRPPAELIEKTVVEAESPSMTLKIVVVETAIGFQVWSARAVD